MGPEHGLFDEHVGPRPRDQLPFGDRLAGALNQRNRNIERTAPEAYGSPVSGQHALGGYQPKRSEDEVFFIHRAIASRRSAIGTDRGGLSQASGGDPADGGQPSRHLQKDAKTLLQNSTIVNATYAAGDAKLPPQNQTEGTAMTTNDDAEPQRLFNCNILGSIGRAIAAFPGQPFHALREHL